MAAKDFAKTPKVDGDEGETQPGFIYIIALTIGLMFYDVLRCFYNHFQTSGQCETYAAITHEFEALLNRVSIGGNFRTLCEAYLRSACSQSVLPEVTVGAAPIATDTE